ncbi:MAG: hypothetical protein E6R03_07560 [Hyphomicrobiaceae bacterium]|nr:MAG: hypothetical protein E6R03_07560 [Hyphomicrobiaceae bacterium]
MELPQKQWALLEVALADYDKIIKDPQYEIDMGTWYSRDPDRNVCYVCLAGCFLVKSLKWEYGKSFYDLPDPVSNALYNLDRLRMGRYEDEHLYLTWPGVRADKYESIVLYEKFIYGVNPALWREAMTEFVAFLKEKDI